MVVHPGQTIGGYEVIDLLESSREGVTYKVRNAILQRFEVLRVLPASLQEDPETVTRFLREAKVHARMIHPNIVAFYHAAQVDGQLIMTTELAEGKTLAQRRESGPLPIAEALNYVSQVLSALGYAQGLGIVHRDVTTSNIILTANGAVKLTGFSLAKTTTDPQLTQPGTVKGSLNYISPEQIKGLAGVDGRTDIYSLGVVLYEAVTGRRPFHRKSQFEVMLAHMNELPQAPTIVNPDVPAELSEIVLTAMAKDPASRFQTPEEFQRRLDRLRGIPEPPSEAAVRQAQVPPSGIVVRQRAQAGKFPDRRPVAGWHPWRQWAAGLFILLMVVLTLLAVVRRS